MKPSEDATLPSTLAMQPHNEAASELRRVRMLLAFDQLSEDDRADLLEAIESTVITHGTNKDYINKAREIMRRIYANDLMK
jgi:hypothetical protein